MPETLTVLSARAVKSAVTAIAQRFFETSGVTVTFEFAPVGTIEKRLADGAHADVVILSESAIGRLLDVGRLAGGAQILGRTSIGVAVRDGAPLPDIATPEAFKSLLLSSPTIAVSDPAVGGTAALYLPELFARMGIATLLEPKLVRCAGGGDVTGRVARGEAAIGITFISEMLAVAGATVVGPLPAPFGNDTTYSAAVMEQSEASDVAARFVAALATPDTQETWRAAGFEPAQP